MIRDEDIEFNDRHEVIYKGVNLYINRENITDYQLQTGFDPKEMLEMVYNNSVVVIRDNKIKSILNENI